MIVVISTNERNFNQRDFIAAIRRRLEARGEHGIEVHRSWIDDAVPGEIFTLTVPLSATLSAPLTPLSDILDLDGLEALESHAAYFAQALVNLKRAADSLERYVASIRKAVATELAIVRDHGVDIRLEHVGLHPVSAWNLNGSSWHDAIEYIRASVTLRGTSSILRSSVRQVRIGGVSDVAGELAKFREIELERRNRIDELDALGADAEIDAITVDLLSTHGFDVTRELRKACREQNVRLPIRHAGLDTEVSLFNLHGRVTSSIALEQARWNGEALWYREPDGVERVDVRAGTCLGELVPHPAFTSRPIARVEDGVFKVIDFAAEDVFLFDADSGRLWRSGRRLAA